MIAVPDHSQRRNRWPPMGQRLLTLNSAKLSAETRLGPDSFPTERLARSMRASYRIRPTGHRPEGWMTVLRYWSFGQRALQLPGWATDELVLTTGLVQLRPTLVGWSNALWLTTSIPPLPPASVLYLKVCPRGHPCSSTQVTSLRRNPWQHTAFVWWRHANVNAIGHQNACILFMVNVERDSV